MNAIFMGTPEFALHSLKCLKNNGFEISLVITQPDKKQGRKNKISFSPVKEKAIELGLPLEQFDSIKSSTAIETIESIQPDVIVVAAYGQILPAKILSIPTYGCINVHASLLPRWRGASPINAAIINGDTTTGITTMYMDTGLDTGDIILQDELAIEPEDNSITLTEKLGILSEKTLGNTLNMIKLALPLNKREQNDQEATYAPIMKKEDGLIDFSKDAETIINKIRGTLPWPVSYTFLGSKRFKIYSAKDSTISSTEKPGTITRVTENSIIVSTGTSDIQFLELQMEGKKRMMVADFLRGAKITEGEIFTLAPQVK